MDLKREFSKIHKHIKNEGLLRKCPAYYDVVILRNICMLAVVFATAILLQKYSGNFLFQMPVALALGFVFGQFAFLAHDTGHEQVTSNVVPLVLMRYFTNIFLYGSLTGWRIKHDLHHNEPNNLALDPDCDIPLLAFTREQAENKYGVARFLVKYQHLFLLPISTLTTIGMRLTGIQFLLRTRHPKTVLELALTGVSLLGYTVLWVSTFGILKAFIFMLVAEGSFGLYMGMTFVTNHYGRSFEPTSNTDFLTKQVVTARNVGSSFPPLDALIHFFYGGLNRQIEHHLWPYMPRCNLKRAEQIVRKSCKEIGIDHHVISPFGAYKEIFYNFADIGKHLRSCDKKKAYHA